jgi:hypothetical protein
MVFAVAVDVPPVEVALAERTLATCNAVLGSEQCVLSGADGASRWYAVVRYGLDGKTKLTIELYERNRGGSRVASSELEFKESDPKEERWASAGVVVAALVLAQPAEQNDPEQGPARAPAGAELSAPTAQQPALRRTPWLRLDLGVAGGSSWWRLGPFARLGVAFADRPLFAFGSAAYTFTKFDGTKELKWLTGSLGAGARVYFAEPGAALDFRAELVLETLGIQATDGERSESARRTRFGPRFGVDLSAYFAPNWAILLGVEAGVMSPRIVLEVAGQTQELRPLDWGTVIAIRYDFR